MNTWPQLATKLLCQNQLAGLSDEEAATTEARRDYWQAKTGKHHRRIVFVFAPLANANKTLPNGLSSETKESLASVGRETMAKQRAGPFWLFRQMIELVRGA